MKKQPEPGAFIDVSNTEGPIMTTNTKATESKYEKLIFHQPIIYIIHSSWYSYVLRFHLSR